VETRVEFHAANVESGRAEAGRSTAVLNYREVFMELSVVKWLKVVLIVVLGIAIGVGGVMLGEYDDAPGASLVAIFLMFGAFGFAVRVARRKAP
jgi:hypothetical protein